jgi:hypothetical protein
MQLHGYDRIGRGIMCTLHPDLHTRWMVRTENWALRVGFTPLLLMLGLASPAR